MAFGDGLLKFQKFLTTAAALPSAVTGDTVADRSRAHVGEIVNPTEIRNDPTVSTSPHTTSGFIAQGTFTNVASRNGGTVQLNQIRCLLQQTASFGFTLIIYDTQPTIISAQAAALQVAISEFSSLKWKGNLRVPSAAWEIIDNTSVNKVTALDLWGLKRKITCAAGSRDLYWVLKSNGSITFAATNSFSMLTSWEDK